MSSENSSSSKKKIAASAVAVALAAVLMIGGTFSYLKSKSTAVVNDFTANTDYVDLSETTGEDYNIIPGTSEEKDPTITYTATVETYVFVEITDATDGLVTWEIADGWTLLSETTDEETGVTTYVYYQKVDATGYEDDGTTLKAETLSVLKNNTVYYSAALDNDDMLESSTDEDGNTTYTLKDDLTLTFQAYSLQAEPFYSNTASTDEDGNTTYDEASAAQNAWLAIVYGITSDVDGDIVEASTTEELAAALTSSDAAYVVLTDDVTLSTSTSTYISSDKTLDLNDNDLTLTSGNYYGFYVYNDAELTIVGDGEISTVYSAIYAASGTVSIGEDGSEITITTSCSTDAVAWLTGDSTMIVGENVTLKHSGSSSYGGIYIYSTADLELYGSIEVNGSLAFAIYTCGESTTTTDSVVNIYEGASVINSSGIAIYQATGTYNIYGGDITGTTGIYMRSGNLTISGENATITATRSETGTRDSSNSAGAYDTGDALIIDNSAYPQGEPNVSISAGTYSATATGASAVTSVYTSSATSAVTGFISGGSYSTNLDVSYLASGYSVISSTDDDGATWYTVN